MPAKTPCPTMLTLPSGKVTRVSVNSVVRNRPYFMFFATARLPSNSGGTHDKVLQVIYNFLKEHLPTYQSIIADLHNLSPYLFPPHIARTDLRPDIVIWNDTTRSVLLLELTVCPQCATKIISLRHINGTTKI